MGSDVKNFVEHIPFLLGQEPRLIVDIGAQGGETPALFLERFPGASVVAFEPEPSNFATCYKRLARFGARVALVESAVADHVGRDELNVNSHGGTHSFFEIGAVEFWAEKAQAEGSVSVAVTTLDHYFRSQKNKIDVLHMDIQGSELSALKGASGLMSMGRISVIYAEVCFVELYRGQPLFWEIGAFLNRFGFRFFDIYEPVFHRNNPRFLCWANAAFVHQDLCGI